MVGLHQAEGCHINTRARSSTTLAGLASDRETPDPRSDVGSRQTAGQSPRPKDPPDLHQLVHQRLWTTMDILGHESKDQARPWTNCRPWRSTASDYGSEGFVAVPVRPSATFASPGGIVVSSVYVHLRSLVFGLMRQCRSQTLTVFAELLYRLLKIGRSALPTTRKAPRNCLVRRME